MNYPPNLANPHGMPPMGGMPMPPNAPPGAPIPPAMMMQMLTQMVAKGKMSATIAANEEEIPPNTTLYVNNLNDKFQVQFVKEQIQELFKPHGEVLDVVCMGSYWRRGQCFVVFKDQTDATNAMRSLDGLVLNGKPMRIRYAKAKSDATCRSEGVEVHREKRTLRLPGLRGEASDLLSLMLSDVESGLEASPPVNEVQVGGGKKRRQGWEGGEPPPKTHAVPAPGGFPSLPPGFAVAPPTQAQASTAVSSRLVETRREEIGQPTPMPPNKLLLVEGVDKGAADHTLRELFARHSGFVDLRVLSSRGIAFAEFISDAVAGRALLALHGTRVGESVLRLSFSKK
eukprot:GHVR01192996.1.p1 GENE.GHVR01192996.1~~GHVR01192996.1.p1  ORF type:complete len:342 (+),score=101.20 GHVR01192996.1:54-1079(+)